MWLSEFRVNELRKYRSDSEDEQTEIATTLHAANNPGSSLGESSRTDGHVPGPVVRPTSSPEHDEPPILRQMPVLLSCADTSRSDPHTLRVSRLAGIVKPRRPPQSRQPVFARPQAQRSAVPRSAPTSTAATLARQDQPPASPSYATGLPQAQEPAIQISSDGDELMDDLSRISLD
jgi:hypothetical protein